MTIHLNSTCRLAKAFSVKREKQEDDTERVIAHLKIGETFIDRDQVDELLRQPIGWSSAALFDELGAPRARLTLSMGGVHPLTFVGVIRGEDTKNGPKLTLKEAAIDGVALELTKLGALLSCQLSWQAAGDEIDDISEMLGSTCAIVGTIEDGGQADLLAPLQRLANRDGTTMTISTGGVEIAKIEPKTGQTISSASETMKLLQKGWVLIEHGIDGHGFDLESPDGKTRRHVWNNAANSCLKRGLVSTGNNVDGFRHTWQERAA